MPLYSWAEWGGGGLSQGGVCHKILLLDYCNKEDNFMRNGCTPYIVVYSTVYSTPIASSSCEESKGFVMKEQEKNDEEMS